MKSYNDISSYLNRRKHLRKISPRMICYTGFKCNLRCRFCYYLESIECGNAENRSLSKIKKQLKMGRKSGKTQVEFTGGEPTLVKDLPDLLSFSRDLGYQEIGIITNGFRMADLEYCKELIDAGLSDVLFSFHSYDPAIHDWLTQTPGSHEKLHAAVNNIKTLGLKFRFNSVVTTANYRVLKPHMEFLSAFKPDSVNLIVFNPSEEVRDYHSHDPVRFTSYDDIGLYISEAIKEFEDQIPAINVRFIPFCFMKGYEAHVRDYWQAIYESREWDPFLHMGYRKGFLKVVAAIVIGFIMRFGSVARYGKKSCYDQMCEDMQTFRVFALFKHVKGCRNCALRLICPGLHRDFLKMHGSPSVHPYENIELIRNPVGFAYPRYVSKFPGLQEDADSYNEAS